LGGAREVPIADQDGPLPEEAIVRPEVEKPKFDREAYHRRYMRNYMREQRARKKLEERNG
jgi:hypothetical protein